MDQPTESFNSLPKDPSLKRYFKYMLINRNMSVQFTTKKIKEIIEKDLEINPDEQNGLYKRVCIDAFVYYMQNWPEWNMALKSVYTDRFYDCLVIYLRNKLESLKARVDTYITEYNEKHTINVPDDVLNAITNADAGKNSKVVFEVDIPEKMWNTVEISFKSVGKDDIVLELEKVASSIAILSLKDILNHPYVSVEFNMPGLIHIQRSCPFRLERHLHKSNVVPQIENDDYIISIEQNVPLQNPKVYTQKLMAAFLSKISEVLAANYNTKVPSLKQIEVSTVCTEFLQDIIDANVCDSTVCEGYAIQYNMGSKKYYFKKQVSNISTSDLVYNKILIPVVSYSLVSCSLLQEDIIDNEFKYFDFVNKKDKTFETTFLQNINNSITYKCIVCDCSLNWVELKKHLQEFHPLDLKVQCAKCLISFVTHLLLSKRWNHFCKTKEKP